VPACSEVSIKVVVVVLVVVLVVDVYVLTIGHHDTSLLFFPSPAAKTAEKIPQPCIFYYHPVKKGSDCCKQALASNGVKCGVEPGGVCNRRNVR